MAGFTDGEGWIGLRGRKGPYDTPSVTITNTNESVLLRFAFKFGGGICTPKTMRPGHKRTFAWQVSGLKARIFLHAIYPYLIVKRPQAEAIFDYEKTLIGYRGRGATCRVSSSALDTRTEIRERLAALNRKGMVS